MFVHLVSFLLLFFNDVSLGSGPDDEPSRAYVVYLGGTRNKSPDAISSIHYDVLFRATGLSGKSLIYSYKYAFSGFSAYLTKQQADVLSDMPEVLSIFPSRTLHPFTTRSWDFLGLPQDPAASSNPRTLEMASASDDDLIVGLLDTGIWPEAPSFNTKLLMGPVPARWKGACVNAPGTNASDVVKCNRKIIGAKYYRAGLSPNASLAYSNPRDFSGHGTGTSAIAVGMPVKEANLEGLALGTARGGFPGARLAMYKVCWTFECYDIDIVAALDDAIHDGVDILSLSLGGDPVSYNVDSIAIGAYHAIERGIVVSCACGNSGPFPGSVSNGAPWILTVGASSIDRVVYPNGSFPFKPAPIAESFTSRGPNSISPDIIKPDVTAPGVSILTAWSPAGLVPDPRNNNTGWHFINANYSIASGTSFAAPHATGVIAYLKSVHPSWSAAAIKSAIMTTATDVDDTNKPITEEDGTTATPFSIGSGELQPVKAMDPGLIYDTTAEGYILYLCSAGYTPKQIQNITGNSSTDCPKDNVLASLNYPSISFTNMSSGSQTVERTVTNVGNASSVYEAQVGEATDPRLVLTVTPSKLVFTSVGQQLKYSVTASFPVTSGDPITIFSVLVWKDGKHVVRSPVAVSL